MRNLSRRHFLFGSSAALAGAYLARGAYADDKPKLPFRLCLNSSTINWKLQLPEMIDLAATAGYDAIEPWTREIDVFVKGGGSLKDLGKKAADKGIAIDSVIGFFEWCVDDDAKRAKGLENAKHDMDWCAQLGAKSIACPPVGATNAPVALDKCTERYKALCELADKMSVRAELELWGFSKTLGKISDVVQVVKDCGNPNACILLDVFHLYKGGNNFADVKSIDGTKITTFHMNDYPADPPVDKINDSFRIYPGDGTAPLTQLFKDLKSNGFKGVLSLELFNRDEWKRDPATVAKIGIEKLRAAVQKSLE